MDAFKPIRVVHWGLGPVGLAIAQLVSRRTGMTTVGVIAEDSPLVGKDLGDLFGFGERTGVVVNGDPEAVLARARPDITMISCGSLFDLVAPKALQAMEAGSNVICLAEEMTYPWARRADLAEKLDELAHAHGVTVLGTGVNPGFVLDTLVIALSGCCFDIERIRASRIADLSALDAGTLKTRGIGLSPSNYVDGLERGTLVSPVGLEQSIHLIADAIGWTLDDVTESRQPIIAQNRRETADLKVEPGQVAGCLYTAIGYVEGRPRILLENPQQVVPEAEIVERGDLIEIEGEPSIRLNLETSIPPDKGAAALAVNMIPMVLQSGPGLKTMTEMPVPRAVLGDLREMMTHRGPTVEEDLALGWHDPGMGGVSEGEYKQ